MISVAFIFYNVLSPCVSEVLASVFANAVTKLVPLPYFDDIFALIICRSFRGPVLCVHMWPPQKFIYDNMSLKITKNRVLLYVEFAVTGK